jgi:type II secretory pathway component PulF
MTAPHAPPRGFSASAWGVALHAVALFGLFALYVAYVPPAMNTFERYGLMLPKLSQAVIRLSPIVADYWWAMGFAAGALLAADFGVIWALRRLGAAHAILWVATVTLLLGMCAALTVYAIEHPKAMLRDALAR